MPKPTKKLDPDKLYWVCRSCRTRRKKTVEVDRAEWAGYQKDGKCELCDGWDFDLAPIRARRSILELMAEAARGPDEAG